MIVGGGPAGLAAAIALRLRGLRTTLVDTATPPIDKACGEGLMPDGVAALRALGVRAEQHEHAIFRGIRFVGSKGSVQAEFPSGHGIGLRRTVLHNALLRRAEETGVEMHWGIRANGIRPGAALIGHDVTAADWIVGADGQNSRVRAWAGLSRGIRKTLRIGLRRHFRVERWTDLVEVHWGQTGQAYVTPVADDEVCVAVISRNRHVRFESLIDECPQLVRNLQHAAPLDDVRGSGTATCKLRSVIGDRLALIGEASGSVDAVTGEGMTLAFRQAVHLASALASNDLKSYAVAHRRIGRLPNLLGSAMLLMDHSTRFRTRALNALAGKPALFEHLLAVHLGETSPLSFGTFADLGWQLLTAR